MWLKGIEGDGSIATVGLQPLFAGWREVAEQGGAIARVGMTSDKARVLPGTKEGCRLMPKDNCRQHSLQP
jgi:hypothetical protein